MLQSWYESVAVTAEGVATEREHPLIAALRSIPVEELAPPKTWMAEGDEGLLLCPTCHLALMKGVPIPGNLLFHTHPINAEDFIETVASAWGVDKIVIARGVIQAYDRHGDGKPPGIALEEAIQWAAFRLRGVGARARSEGVEV
jgi:hypothetical protein